MTDDSYSPVGSYDPDTEDNEVRAIKRPSWSIPQTPLAQSALSACGRQFFKGNNKKVEFASWKEIEEKTLGEDDESYLYTEWVKSRIEYVAKFNSTRLSLLFDNLMRQINNNEKRIDWIIKNRNRVLAKRQVYGKDELEKLLISNK
jgi:hypothetical protein